MWTQTAAAKLGAQAQLNERVVQVDYRDKRFLVTTAHGAKYTADAVACAMPAYAAADAFGNIGRSIASALGRFPTRRWW